MRLPAAEEVQAVLRAGDGGLKREFRPTVESMPVRITPPAKPPSVPTLIC